jgi:hypothetical protein
VVRRVRGKRVSHSAVAKTRVDGMGPKHVTLHTRGRNTAGKDLSCASARRDACGGRETMRARGTYLTAGAGAADHFHDDGTAGGGGRGRWSADVRGGETLKYTRLELLAAMRVRPVNPGRRAPTRYRARRREARARRDHSQLDLVHFEFDESHACGLRWRKRARRILRSDFGMFRREKKRATVSYLVSELFRAWYRRNPRRNKISARDSESSRAFLARLGTGANRGGVPTNSHHL